ncbi:MAG: heme exporter protein CcmB [Armatimonadetes bacterium]|nr:heme exporter protein CcmB [Armatimonadota bacterium]
MKSDWTAETFAVLRKEAITELRGRYGLYATLLFSVMAVTAIGLASASTEPSPALAAGMFWVALLFAAVTGLARTFLLEEEQGTGDLLRLWAKPGPVFWGKLIYNFVLILVVSVILVPLFVLFVGVSVANWGLLVVALLAGCAALSSGISVCGALAARARGRSVLTGVLSIPVLFSVVLLGVGAVSVAFGALVAGGWPSVAGLAGISLVFLAAGPYLFAGVWKQ